MSFLDSLSTEQVNPETIDIDRLDSLGVLERLNAQDRQVAGAVHAALPEIARAVDLTLERWNRGGRVVLFGAGTSGRLAMLDAAELPPTFGVDSQRYLARVAGGTGAFERATEGAEDDRAAGNAAAADLVDRDVAFGIAASGRTPWVIGALEQAHAAGALTVGLASVPRPELRADIVIVVDTGPEAIGGSTRLKAGTAQKMVLNAFSTALMVRLGKVYRNLMVDVQTTNAKLRRRAVRLVEQTTGVDAATAERALAASGWDVKSTIASVRLGISAEEARARLAQHDGHLRRVLGET